MVLCLFSIAWLGSAMAAPLQRVVPPDRHIGVPMGERWVPRDSLVQAVDIKCADGHHGIRIHTVDKWYRRKNMQLVQPGEEGCLSPQVLQGADIPVGDPVSEAQLRAVFTERFGGIDTSALKSTPWGRIALPMTHELSVAARAAEIEREGLVTQKQQQRAVVAEGPSRDGAPVYAHFLGSDAPRSDRWGTLATVTQILALADEWSTHCRTILPNVIAEANAATCLLQIGDLAWYNDDLPDPLGHREHYRGTCVDIRLFRTEASRYEAWWNKADDRSTAKGGYSQALTQAFLRFAIENASPTVIHFNDPVVMEALPLVTAARGHDDHIHMCFAGR